MSFHLGLTGSIGMGKTSTARMFADLGCAVWDADAAVHRLYAKGGAAVPALRKLFPGIVINGAISRDALREVISRDKTVLPKLEQIVHPLVQQDRRIFASQADEDILVFDIPLLFETGADQEMDATACVYVSPDIQKDRVLARGTMTEAELDLILERQMPSAEKCARATYVIETDRFEHAREQVLNVYNDIMNRKPCPVNRGQLMREIVLDTETTGFDPFNGDRLVEIGAIELDGHLPTGNTYHQYIYPERDMPDDAFKVHGIGPDLLTPPRPAAEGEVLLKDKPVFKKIGQAFLDFIGDSKLVIHNASFDMKFLNAELGWAGLPKIPDDRAIDTLAIARRKFPGAQASLDALCRRFNIDNSSRVLHGALLDSEILAEVYLELIGGKQPDFGLSMPGQNKGPKQATQAPRPMPRPTPLAPKLTESEKAAHAAFVEKLGENALWRRS